MWGLIFRKILVKAKRFAPLSIKTQISFPAYKILTIKDRQQKLESIGAKIGLSEYEIQLSLSTPSPITGKPLPSPTSPFSKFCISTILIGILIVTVAFMLLISHFWEDGIEWSNPFYIPGSLYGTVKQSDFW